LTTEQYESTRLMDYGRYRLTASVAYYAHVRVNQWSIGLPCLPIGQFVKN